MKTKDAKITQLKKQLAENNVGAIKKNLSQYMIWINKDPNCK